MQMQIQVSHLLAQMENNLFDRLLDREFVPKHHKEVDTSWRYQSKPIGWYVPEVANILFEMEERAEEELAKPVPSIGWCKAFCHRCDQTSCNKYTVVTADYASSHDNW